jgi:hypothetical protein
MKHKNFMEEGEFHGVEGRGYFKENKWGVHWASGYHRLETYYFLFSLCCFCHWVFNMMMPFCLWQLWNEVGLHSSRILIYKWELCFLNALVHFACVNPIMPYLSLYLTISICEIWLRRGRELLHRTCEEWLWLWTTLYSTTFCLVPQWISLGLFARTDSQSDVTRCTEFLQKSGRKWLLMLVSNFHFFTWKWRQLWLSIM